jgi:co-chaperonin GroES (HSP10)
MKIIPNHNRILVKQIITDQKETANGLIALPSTADREQKTQGKVLKVGKGIKNIKVGMTVFYGRFAGEILKVMEKDKETEYVLLQNDEVLGWLI